MDDASGTTLSDVAVRGLGGHVLTYARHPPSLTHVHTTGMDGRLTAPWVITWRERLLDATAHIKPDLRVLYETVASRERYAPALFAVLAGFLVLLASYEALHRRRLAANAPRFHHV